jgi:hypothetical protein
MRTRIIYFTIMLTCLSCNVDKNADQKSSSRNMTKKDEILKLMRDRWIGIEEKEKADYFIYFSNEIATKMVSELEKIKKDYFYEPDPNLFFTTPGHSWEIEGPLSINELKEKYKTDKRFDFINKYKDGDEIYFWRSNKQSWRDQRGREGYVLIRKNKLIDIIWMGLS